MAALIAFTFADFNPPSDNTLNSGTTPNSYSRKPSRNPKPKPQAMKDLSGDIFGGPR